MNAGDNGRPLDAVDLRSPGVVRWLNPRRLLNRLASKSEYLRLLIVGTWRRQGWFVENLNLRRFINMVVGGGQFLLKSERMRALPMAVKIDISPMCNLSCTVCVHADPNGDPNLEKQEFHPQHRMSVEQFRRIIREIRNRTSAVSLYYVGDPLVHPDLDEMCGIAYDAGLMVHVSTNFSFALTDARIRRIVRSGLTHLSICVDGLSQEKYERTRVGGRIDRVLSNLERVCRFRREMGRRYPKVEVQYIKFQHNVDELPAARALFERIGVDQVTDFWGDLGNYTHRDPGSFEVRGPRPRRGIPQCYWPHSSMVIKYNGDVIPCCSYRIGHQYTPADDPHILGNVFETSLAEVWNNARYRQARRMVSDPRAVLDDPSLKNHFCYGCPAIFETTDHTPLDFADKNRWEDLYALGEDGRPVARPRGGNGASVSRIGLPGGHTVSV
jgi:MoaA/NifB/PqqE/SkfB family radical SAM enzyme